MARKRLSDTQIEELLMLDDSEISDFDDGNEDEIDDEVMPLAASAANYDADIE